jgi:hypothetical protein
LSSIILDIKHPSVLTEPIEANLSELPGNYNFKPHIGLLENGDIIMFTAHAHAEETVTAHNVPAGARSLTTHVVMYKSPDGGITWSGGRHIPELMCGHEPSVSVIDGIVFVTVSIHGSGYFPDPHAKRDHTYSLIARSTDNGETFTTTIFDRDRCETENHERIDHSRNIIKLTDRRLYFGLGLGARHRSVFSDDLGITWYFRECAVPGAEYEEKERSFFTEAVFFYTNSRRLMMLSRVDFAYAGFGGALPNSTNYIRETGLDNFDGEVLFESADNGASWTPLRAVGFPSLMYPSVVNLKDNKMLLTFTVREIPPEGTGCIYPKVGVQAIIFQETPDGSMEFDFSRDVIVIDDSTPDSMRNAGCFGNTLELPDGSLVTPYSFPKIDHEILEIANNKEYLKQEVFDKYAKMQTTYPYRYSDFVQDDKALMELNLRRNFSALFLYAGCCNKGGIGTRVVRWRI